MTWVNERWVAVDTETTGKDPFDARIVTAAVVHFNPGTRPRTINWVVDPGVPIPDEAAEVHGWTTERITAYRDAAGNPARKPGQAMYEIAGQVALAMSQGVPVIAFNAAYDLTVIEAECRRHKQPTLAQRLGNRGVHGVVDPMVLEKQFDPYRKACYKAPGCRPDEQHHECGGCRGSKKTNCGGCGITDRKLSSLARHYGVVFAADGAHDAATDAVATVRLLQRLLAAQPAYGRMPLAKLFQAQIGWRRSQMDGLREFMDKVGKEHDGCCGEFPVHVQCARQAVPA